LRAAGVDVVVMAGFGTVLGEPIHAAYPGRVLNTHPALLPAFPGWHAVADALAAGVSETGTTVHIATLEMDAGPVLAQATVAVLPDDTEDTLHERIKSVERSLYPDTIRRFIDGLAATVGDGPGSPPEVAT
jgi:phosphoribosylglycinamide formyltransferase-1